MKTSDIVQLKRDITTALDAAGRKEMGWYVFVEKLDELGYDIVQRPPVTKPLQTSSVDWIEPPRVQTDFDGVLAHADQEATDFSGRHGIPNH